MNKMALKTKFLSEVNEEFFQNKRILLRIDTDVDLRKEGDRLVVDEDFRLRSVLPTIHFLVKAGVEKIVLLGHLGRPQGKVVPELSLKPVADWLSQKLGSCQLLSLENLTSQIIEQSKSQIILLENIRFSPGEEANEEKFVRRLTGLGDVYINDAFAVSHRDHASITGLPKLLTSFLGLRFEAEVRTLTWIRKKAERPIVFVLGGSKSGKLGYISFLGKWADYLLIGGKLPLLLADQGLKPESDYQSVIVGRLTENGRDIAKETVDQFRKIISQAKTLIWAGPMGVYEEEENQQGTFEIVQAIAKRQAFKIAGGGDTHRVLSWLNLWQKFDFVSVGGGAMLQFLRDQTLPGIEAL